MKTLEQGPLSLIVRIIKNPVLWIFVATFVFLAKHPIPDCVACEFPNPWGRDDMAYAHYSTILEIWFIAASFTAGLCSLRKYWLVPLVIVFADLVTQPLGGVELSSLWGNEGPVIIILGGLVGTAALLLGFLVGVVVGSFGGSRSIRHPQ